MKKLNRSKKYNLIVFSGADGSGKTTLAKMIALLFKKKKMRVKIVRIRGSHTIAYLLLILLKQFNSIRGEGLHYYNIKIPNKLKSLWILIELLSISILIVLYYHIYPLIYKVVISERGPLDFAIWIITGVRPKLKSAIMRVFLRITTSWIIHYHTIYVRADKAILIKRKASETFLINTMYPVYESLAKSLNLPVVDTSNTSPVDACRNILIVLYKL